VDKKKAHLLRFPTLNEGRPPQKPIQREGKEGVRLYRIGVSAFPETLCIKTVWWTVFVISLFEFRYCYLISTMSFALMMSIKSDAKIVISSENYKHSP
jgi:hypothetical protein